MSPFVNFSTYNKDNPFGAVDPVFYPATHHHIGSDFKVPVGTSLLSPCKGEVIKAVFNAARGNTAIFFFTWEGQGWGLELCHLRELPNLGKYETNQCIAHSGNSGSASTAPHLHVVMHKDCQVTKNYAALTSEAAYFKLVKEGRLVDPYQWFKGRLINQ